MINRIVKRFFYRLRSNFITEDLVKKGLKVGTNFIRMHDVILDPSHCWLISIGNNVTLAPRVHVLAHDASTKVFVNYTKIGKVTIGNNVFIGADTVILPNVTIGSNVIVGANSTVSKNIESNTVYAGNPAKFICTIEEFKAKNTNLMTTRPCYGENFSERENISDQMKQKMRQDLEDGFGYII